MSDTGWPIRTLPQDFSNWSQRGDCCLWLKGSEQVSWGLREASP